MSELRQTLTKTDLEILRQIINESHTCRFNNVDSEDMDFIKDLLKVYKETRSEIIKWIVKGVIYAIGALFLLGLYFKFNGKF